MYVSAHADRIENARFLHACQTCMSVHRNVVWALRCLSVMSNTACAFVYQMVHLTMPLSCLHTEMSMPILRQLSSPEDDSPKCYHRKKSYKKRGQWRSRETYSINALDGVYSLQPLVWVLKQSWLVVVTFIFVGFDFGSRCYFCTAHGCDLESTWFCPFVINLLLRTVIAACGPIMLGKLSRAGLEVDLCFSKSFLVGPYRNHLLNERSIDISVRKPEDLVIQMKVNLERTARHFFGWSSVHALIMSAVCIMLSHYDPDHFLETSGSLVDALWSCFAILADVVVSSVALGSICAVMALYHCYRDVLTMILQLSGHPNTSTNKVLNQMNRIIKRFSVIAVIIVLGFSAEVAMAALVRKANHSKPQLYEEQSLDIVFCFVILTVALASCPLVLTKVLAVVLDVFILLKTTYYVQRVRKHSCLLNSVLEYHIIALGIAAALLLQEMTIQFSAIRQSQKRSKLCSIFHITLSLSILCCYILKSTLVS